MQSRVVELSEGDKKTKEKAELLSESLGNAEGTELQARFGVEVSKARDSSLKTISSKCFIDTTEIGYIILRNEGHTLQERYVYPLGCVSWRERIPREERQRRRSEMIRYDETEEYVSPLFRRGLGTLSLTSTMIQIREEGLVSPKECRVYPSRTQSAQLSLMKEAIGIKGVLHLNEYIDLCVRFAKNRYGFKFE